MSIHNFANAIVTGSSGQGGGVVEQSLKFNDDESQYLSWTPSSASSSDKQFTFSCWVKRGNFGSYQVFLGTPEGGDREYFGFMNTDQFLYQVNNGTNLISTQVFRDSAAWYHVVVAVNINESTASDRQKIYINGEQITSFSSANYYGSSDTVQFMKNGAATFLGRLNTTNAFSFDGYMTDVHFIDGQTLGPTSFGQTINGYWAKKNYSGSYGTNGFKLHFRDDTVSEGFNAVTYTGNGGTQSISGLGFEPDLVWVKNRSSGAGTQHILSDSVRGSSGGYLYKLLSSYNGDENYYSQGAYGSLTSIDADGFSVGSSNGDYQQTNASGNTYVGWCWDAGDGSPVSNTDGTITATVKANPDYGFSIISYTGNSVNNATIGTGLSSEAEMVIIKNRTDDTANDSWPVWHKDIGTGNYLSLSTTDAALTSAVWNDGGFTNDAISISNWNGINKSGTTYIGYAWHSVAGYSSIGSYTGNGSASGPTVTTGFRPAFVMVKRTDSTGNWVMYDNTRVTSNPINKLLYPNLANAEATWGSGGVDFNATGFQVKNSGGDMNVNGGNFIYMAFADTREAAFWKDVSGENNNDWQPNNLDYRDSVIDSPANNWCVIRTMNDPEESGVARTEGNLKYTTGSGTSARNTNKIGISNILPSTGKWYAEVRIHNTTSSFVGVGTLQSVSPTSNNTRYAYLYSTDGNSYVRTGASESISTHGGAVSVGDVVGIYVDMDAATPELYFSKNGQWSNGSGSFNQSTPTSAITLGDTFFTADTSNENQLAFHCSAASSGTSAQFIWNFGQDSTFAGNETAGGNVDANGIGDFFSTVPDDALALCTANLPTPAIINGTENFNTVLYTGSGSTQTVTGLDFEPNFVWIKSRSNTTDHYLHDSVRGDTKILHSNTTDAEDDWAGTGNGMVQFVDGGFELSGGTGIDGSTRTYVSWNWKAGGTAVSNTDGSITSQVSANTTAGFSIVSYTGTGANATVGHGLNSAPDLVIVKNRSIVSSSLVRTQILAANQTLLLENTTTPIGTDYWQNTQPNSSVITVSSNSEVNGSGNNLIAYCFHSVDGYSSIGSYTGNGNADGPFIYTGFRPAGIIAKNTIDNTTNWWFHDNKRLGYNANNYALFPNLNYAEDPNVRLDILSNGFKIRTTAKHWNTSAQTFIYMAFAESPFKYSNAR